MALTGYDPSTVSTAIDNVNSSYTAILTALVDTNKSSFVDPMSAIWGSPQAKKFFTDYKNVITSMCTEVTNVFKSVVESMSSAASSLASIAGASWGAKELSAVTKELDVSCIKEDIGGVIGIDQQQATSIASQLDTILQAVRTALQEARTAVSNSGFVGGEMQSSLLSSLIKIDTNISNSFTEVKSQVVQAIQETVDTYTTTSTNVSSAFGGGN